MSKNANILSSFTLPANLIPNLRSEEVAGTTKYFAEVVNYVSGKLTLDLAEGVSIKSKDKVTFLDGVEVGPCDKLYFNQQGEIIEVKTSPVRKEVKPSKKSSGSNDRPKESLF